MRNVLAIVEAVSDAIQALTGVILVWAAWPRKRKGRHRKDD